MTRVPTLTCGSCGKEYAAAAPGCPYCGNSGGSPWRPGVAGLSSLAFGLWGGALVTYLNLRTLNAPWKAGWVLSLTILGTAVYGLGAATVPDAGLAVGLFLYFVGVFVYPLLQKSEFNAWQAEHRDIEPKNGWQALPFGIASATVSIIFFFVLQLLAV